VALKNGANLIGMDLTDTAVENATERIKEFNLAGEARFQVGEFTSTGLPDSSCDGVMSADVLIFLPNPLEGFREVARILKTTSMFVFTNWESYLPGRLGDHRPLLEDAGFSILKYEHAKKAWMDRQRQVYVDTLKSEQALIDEMSIECATPWLMDAKTNLQLLDKMKRIFVAVQKN
jgi:ubiquinone/menaquinone biosynthesis C-methylase UbiE